MLKKTQKDTSKNARKIPGIGLYITIRKFNFWWGETLGKYNRYTVYMDDCAAIIIEIDKGCDRPNNMSDDEIIDVYMENNYCGRNYEVEEGDPDKVFLDEEDIWGLVEEWWNKSEFLRNEGLRWAKN